LFIAQIEKFVLVKFIEVTAIDELGRVVNKNVKLILWLVPPLNHVVPFVELAVIVVALRKAETVDIENNVIIKITKIPKLKNLKSLFISFSLFINIT
jgi:hypothetical protein